MAKNNELLFPFDVFPGITQEIIKETHSVLNFPINYIAAALFNAASLAIGNTSALEIKPGWKVKANMYISLVGSPGAVKTHPVDFALAPFAELDKVNFEKYRHEMAEYRKNPDNMEKPSAKQFICKDITIEALAKVHMHNPRGICVHSDELKGFFSSFDKYRKTGGDQAQWMSIYSGNSIVVNRKTDDDIIYVPSPFVNVIGGIQPGILSRLFRGELTENGFLSRFLFVNNSSEDEPLLWTDIDLPSEVNIKWRNFIFRILQLCKYPEYKTKELRFENNAWESIRNWQNEIEKNLAENEPDSNIISLFRKIQDYALKFAIILHTMREADGQIEESKSIDMKTAIYATNIADYFFETAKMVYSYIYDNREDRNKFFQLINSLNNRFTTEQAIKVGSIMGISRRTVFRYLDILPDDPFLKKVKQGVYEKK